MNRTRFSLCLGAGLATVCLWVAWQPASVYSQTTRSHVRLAARAKGTAPAPAATPDATPPALTTRPAGEAPDTAPPTDDPATAGQTETDIDATISASFNSKDRIAVFTGNVRVKDPRFELACDELTVYLNKSAAPDAATPGASATPAPLKPAPAAAAPGTEPTPAPPGGGIDHAVAKGHVIIIQRKAATKPGEEDKLSIGRGGLGTFDNKTGDMVLKDWPNLEQNGSSLVSTAQGTVMTIHRDSSMNTVGPSKTVLIQKHGSSAGVFDFPTGPSTPNKKGNQPPAPVAPPTRNAPQH